VAGARTLLLMDACVVIDFHQAEPEIVALAAKHVGPVHLPTPILAEVPSLTPRTARRMGFTLVEPKMEELRVAAEKLPGLSLQDRLCMEMAVARRWTCVTNDARLRRACEARPVPVMWALELVRAITDAEGMSDTRAVEIATRMHEQNPRGTTATTLRRFIGILRNKKRKGR